MENIQSITPDKVLKVYSGRPGCACGCRGKYSYNPDRQQEGGEDRGYEVSDDELNARQVTRVLRLLQAEPSTEVIDDSILHATIGKRVYAVYLSKKGS